MKTNEMDNQKKFKSEKEYLEYRRNIENNTKEWYNIFYFKDEKIEIFINKYHCQIFYIDNKDFVDIIDTTDEIWNIAFKIHHKDFDLINLIKIIEKNK